MKLPALLLIVSVAANAAMLAAFVSQPKLAPTAVRKFFQPQAVAAEKALAEKESLQRKEAHDREVASRDAAARARLWSTLEAEDLSALIQRLKAAGFPPRVVQQIVEAEVNRRFAPRFRELAASAANRPFWKSEADASRSGYWESYNKIYRDRARLLRTALNDDFFATDTTISAEQRRQFGNLSPAKIAVAERIADDYQEMISQVRSAMRDVTFPEDREKLAYLEQEKRNDLAEVLSPQELEDYQMRHSRVTSILASTMSMMNASEEEFKTIYALLQPHEEVLYPTTSLGNEWWQKRRDLLQQIDNSLKAALGENRFAEYQRASDNEYQQLNRIAQRENVPIEAANRAFDLREKTTAQSNRIYDDPALSVEQKRAALQSLASATRNELMSTLGKSAGADYVKTARWLAQIEEGAAVTVSTRGDYRTRRVSPKN
jgi:hypothetical protein